MIFNAFVEVLSRWKYSLLATLVAFATFTFSIWLPNGPLVREILFGNFVLGPDKLVVLGSLYGSIWTNFNAVSAMYTIIIAILFGINISMLAYYIKQRKGTFEGKTTLAGVGGIVSGLFGIGCAACGTFILSSILVLVGAGGVIAFLPFGGQEFGFLGVILVAYATYWTAKKIKEPIVCEII